MQLQPKSGMCSSRALLGQRGFADREEWDCTLVELPPKSTRALC